MPGTERRQQPRVAADLPLRLTFKDFVVETRILDLSTSGIRFATTDALPLMSRVQIALELPELSQAGSAPLAITGVVVRCDRIPVGGVDHYDTAIYFEELSDGARARLAQFVASQQA